MKLRMGAGLLGSSRMTPIERQAGRFLRAPDHGAGDDDGFEVGAGFANQPGAEIETPPAESEPEEKPKGKKAAAKPEGEEDTDKPEGEEDTDKPEGEGEGEGEGEEEKPKKRPGKQPSERIREQNRTIREQQRRIADFEARFAELEKRLPGGNGGATDDGPAAPDPTDTDKYPLGVLDEKYVEDKIAYVADKATQAAITAALQRQEQADQASAAETQISALREKADDLAVRGAEQFEDYDEIVVKGGLQGDYDLTQITFEAAHEAEHGAQILYDLANNPREATRVAKLSPLAQLRYVDEKNSEIAAKAKPRHKPGASEPPNNTPRGSSPKTAISGATDNLDDFEREFYRKK